MRSDQPCTPNHRGPRASQKKMAAQERSTHAAYTYATAHLSTSRKIENSNGTNCVWGAGDRRGDRYPTEQQELLHVDAELSQSNTLSAESTAVTWIIAGSSIEEGRHCSPEGIRGMFGLFGRRAMSEHIYACCLGTRAGRELPRTQPRVNRNNRGSGAHPRTGVLIPTLVEYL